MQGLAELAAEILHGIRELGVVDRIACRTGLVNDYINTGLKYLVCQIWQAMRRKTRFNLVAQWPITCCHELRLFPSSNYSAAQQEV